MRLEDLPDIDFLIRNDPKTGLSRANIYQQRRLHKLSDNEIIMAYYSTDTYSCNAAHYTVFDDHLKSDKCIIMLHDHFNVRLLFEWLAEHRPHLIKKMNMLKAFI